MANTRNYKLKHFNLIINLSYSLFRYQIYNSSAQSHEKEQRLRRASATTAFPATWPTRITIFPEHTSVCAMSRYNTIAETFDFKQRSILNGTREIRNGVTPRSARIEECIYRYVRSTRDARSALYTANPV